MFRNITLRLVSAGALVKGCAPNGKLFEGGIVSELAILFLDA